MKQMINIIIFVALLVIPVTVMAQEPVQATMNTQQETVTVGDVVSLDITVNHPQGWRVIYDELPDVWGDFEVVNQTQPRIIKNADGGESTVWRVDVRLFNTGTFMTPAMPVYVVDEAGVVEPHFVEAYPVTVDSVLVQGDEQLRDIKPQANLLLPIEVSTAPYAISAIVIVLGAVAVYVIMRRHDRPFVDTRTPAERAHDILNEHELLNLSGQADYRELYASVSHTLRQYLEEAYVLPALDRTTREIWAGLQQTSIDNDLAKNIIRLLNICDEVKFAPEVPDNRQNTELLDHAHRLITEADTKRDEQAQTLSRLEEVTA